MADSGYAPGGAPGAGVGGAGTPATDDGLWSLDRCKRAYLDYLGSKREELAERTTARRYRHGAHWTAAQVKALNARKQPVVTYNRIGRKINGVVGLVEKLRTDPKAYPRTPKHEQGAELATATLRYVLDEQEWKAKTPIVADHAATDGICGIAIEIIRGDQGDPEVAFDVVDDDFFYDPRSKRLDFSDATFMGVGKWLDADTAKEMFPDKAAEIDASLEQGSELTSNPDTDNKWFQADGDVRRVRLVDIWFKVRGEWCYRIFTGSTSLMSGPSYLKDEKGRTECRYIMFSANVDHDGDRYGFVRDLKSANDEINQRRSKGLHELNTRRIIAEEGAFQDVEKARREAARPDGMVMRNKGYEAEFDDSAKMNSLEGQIKFLEEAKAEIENFGPNPALLGKGGVENSSGRAINLLQQAGMAELGPFILAFRGWKIRVYRALWNAVRTHWTAERWIRVTDDDGVAQFVGINQLGQHPQTGLPTLINAIGALDVDIILDEGPDQVNMMADAYDTLTVLGRNGSNIPPQVLIELSPLQSSVKKRILDIMAKASQQGPNPLQVAEVQATVADKQAAARLKDAQAALALTEAHMAPAAAAHEAALATAEFKADDQHRGADRAQTAASQAADHARDGAERRVEHDHAALQSHLDRLFQAAQSERGHEQALEQIDAQPAPAAAAA
jgi:hypothetical protein